MLFFFVAAGRYRLAGLRERLGALACAVLVVAGYAWTNSVAAGLSSHSHNLETLTGLFTWLARDFSLPQLAAFLGRGIATFAVPVAALGGLVFRSPQPLSTVAWNRAARCAARLHLTAVLIGLQPLLGGPSLGNLPRLSALGLWCLVFGAAIFLRRRGEFPALPRFSPKAASALGIVLALHSFHHLFSWPGGIFLNEDPRGFLLLQLALSGLLLAGLLLPRPFRPSPAKSF
jgi:hypothetical protein